MRKWFFRTLHRVFVWLDNPSALADYKEKNGTVLLWVLMPTLFAIIMVTLSR